MFVKKWNSILISLCIYCSQKNSIQLALNGKQIPLFIKKKKLMFFFHFGIEW